MLDLGFICMYVCIWSMLYVFVCILSSVCICMYLKFICIYLSVSMFCLYLWDAGEMQMDLDTGTPVAGNHPLVSMPHQFTQKSIHSVQPPTICEYCFRSVSQSHTLRAVLQLCLATWCCIVYLNDELSFQVAAVILWQGWHENYFSTL